MVRRKRGSGKQVGRERDRRYSVRGVRRVPLDVEKFSKALLGLVLADSERQAQADHAVEGSRPTSAPSRDEPSGEGAPDA